MINTGILPPFDYFDLEIDGSEFSNIEVKLEPHCSESDKIIVNSLLKNHGIDKLCEESNLKEEIRN